MASPYQKPFRYLFWFWGLLVIILSLLPGKTLPDLSIWDWLAIDKFGHFAVYACWIFLFRLAYRHRPGFRWMAALILASTGVILELLQGTLYRDRFFEVSDIVANCAGILLGEMAFNHLFKRC